MSEIYFLPDEVQVNAFSPYKLSNAVECIHIPSGLKSVCNEHRSQHRNRRQALSDLKDKVVRKYGSTMAGAK